MTAPRTPSPLPPYGRSPARPSPEFSAPVTSWSYAILYSGCFAHFSRERWHRGRRLARSARSPSWPPTPTGPSPGSGTWRSRRPLPASPGDDWLTMYSAAPPTRTPPSWLSGPGIGPTPNLHARRTVPTRGSRSSCRAQGRLDRHRGLLVGDREAVVEVGGARAQHQLVVDHVLDPFVELVPVGFIMAYTRK